MNRICFDIRLNVDEVSQLPDGWVYVGASSKHAKVSFTMLASKINTPEVNDSLKATITVPAPEESSNCCSENPGANEGCCPSTLK